MPNQDCSGHIENLGKLHKVINKTVTYRKRQEIVKLPESVSAEDDTRCAFMGVLKLVVIMQRGRFATFCEARMFGDQ